MSAETDFRAALAAYAPLTSLVGTKICMNAVEQDMTLPYLVFTAQHNPEDGLNSVQHFDQVTFTVECWAATAAAALAVGEATHSAISSFDATSTNIAAYVTDKTSGYDGTQDLDACVLTVTWIAQ
jgi:hypothetical protein